MKSFRARVLAVLSIAVTGVAACSRDGALVPVHVGDAVVHVEIARTPDERAQGLMFREEVPEGTGMLFVFEREEILSFWMKNTYVPLSVAYADRSGRILEIHDMEPESLAPVRSSRPARYALEVPRGYFERAGIRPGDLIDVASFQE